MKPGLVLVLDRRAGRAAECAAGMLDALDAVGALGVRAARGDGWAGAAIGPAGCVAGCGIVVDGGDVLIWTGDVIGLAGGAGAEAIGRRLLEGLRWEGVEWLAGLDGSFCGAWFNGSAGRWVVFNDRFGLIPVFYAADGERVVVAPQAWLAWRASGRPLKLFEEGFTSILRATNATGDRTLIEGVRWLVSGHVLEVRGGSDGWGEARARCYWEYRCPSRPAVRSFEEAVEAGAEAVIDAVRRCAAGGTDVVMGISGGMDSRLILAACGAVGVRPKTYTLGWRWSEDVRFGRRLARAAGVEHAWIEPSDEKVGDGLERLIVESDGLHSGRHLGMATAVGEYLAGHSGYLLLEGYLLGMVGGSATVEADDVPTDWPAHACRWARRHFHAGGDIEAVDGLLLPDVARRSRQRWESEIDERYRRAPGEDPLRRAEYTIMNGRSGRIDVPGTRLLSEHAVVRSPGTYGRLIQFFASLPADWRRGKRLYAEILRRRFGAFADVQRASSSGLPIRGSRWRREWCWQKEKLHRLWAAWRCPQTRRWGTDVDRLVMWTFEGWRDRGGLAAILEPGARVLAWVDRERLLEAWRSAEADPRWACLVMTVGTVETMVRWLEGCRPLGGSVERVRFRPVEAVEEASCACS